MRNANDPQRARLGILAATDANRPVGRQYPRRLPSQLLGIRERSGAQALVEFALILPVMILILLLAIDFGRLFFSYVQVTNAAREGAAYAINRPDDTSGILAHARQEVGAQKDANGTTGTLDVTVACSPQACLTAATSATQNVVTVAASEPFSFVSPIISNVVGTLSLASSSSAVALGLAGVVPPAQPCVTVPTVNGLSAPAAATNAIVAAGLVANPIADIVTGTRNIASNQSPAAATCVTAGSTVLTFHYRP